MPNESIDARLEAYTPRGLSPREWELCRDVVLAAVRAAQPSNAQHAANLASQMCKFLARSVRASSDRNQVPDLRALLTDEAIVAHTARRGFGSRNSRSVARQYLRALRRAVRGEQLDVIAPPRTAPSNVASFWPLVTETGPFTVLAAAFTARGCALRPESWTRLASVLGIDPAWLRAREDHVIVIAETTANTGVLGNVVSVQACAAALRDAHDATIEVNTVNATCTTTPAAAVSSRPLSRAAAGRAARAAKAAADAARERALDPQPQSVAAIPVPAADIATAIARYTPQKVTAEHWLLVADVVRACMAAYAPPSAAEVTSKASWVVGYCVWLLGRPERLCADRDLQLVELLDADLVEVYVTGHLAGASARSRATARSILRRVVRNLTPGPGPETLGAAAVQRPYTPIECDRFRRLARNQPTAASRRSLSALVALGLGAGLSPQESKVIAPEHLRTVDLGELGTVTAIDVPGRNARTTVVRAAYVDLLNEALDLHNRSRRGRTCPLYGVKPTRRNGANRITADSRTATGAGVDIDAARLRSTWIVAVMSAPVPLRTLLSAAGLRSARTVTDLAGYCPPADPDAVTALLASLADAAISRPTPAGDV